MKKESKISKELRKLATEIEKGKKISTYSNNLEKIAATRIKILKEVIGV